MEIDLKKSMQLLQKLSYLKNKQNVQDQVKLLVNSGTGFYKKSLKKLVFHKQN